jgi:hypothetical protein
MEAAELIETITAAFPLAPIPEVGPHQSHASDALDIGKIAGQEFVTASARDAGRTWQQYADEELARLDAAMAHLPIEGFIYYLPAYLCAAVRHVSRDIFDSWSVFVGHACFQVTGRSDYQLARFRKFTAAQEKAVVHFLEFLVDHADDHDVVVP